MNKTIGNFTFIETPIKDLYEIETKRYGDNRGYFFETYKEDVFTAAGLNCVFVQDNQSQSRKGVLRGLHFQKQYSQTKLVRCIDGEVFDVAVDLRIGSPTFGKWHAVILSSERGNQFLIPKGFAHGFLVLSESATFCYKCDELYHPEDEEGIMWNDKDINVLWPSMESIILSERDKDRKSLKELIKDFDKNKSFFD